MDTGSEKKAVEMIKKYKRQQHRWSSDQTKNLLEAILDKIKSVPEKFEKPTASQFYETLFQEYGLLDLAEIGVIPAKNKIRNLKDTFLKAEEWKRQTGARLLEDRKEDKVREYIEKICPHYTIMEQIFGQRKNIKLPPVTDAMSSEVNNIFAYNAADIYDVKYLKGTDKNKRNENSIENIKIEEHSSKEPQTSSQYSTKKSKAAVKKPKTLKRISSFLQHLLILEEKRNKLQGKKIKRQMKVEKEKIAINKKKLRIEKEKLNYEKDVEYKKLEHEKEKLRAEIELKKFEIEKQFELKKYEFDLKYRNN